ncbi:MAG: GIY-YIG nuclease family protein [bacterium]
MYFVYILRCADDTLYTGIARDVVRRVTAHNESAVGAKYTRSRRPVTLIYSQESADRSSALIEEARIKKLTRTQKLAFIQKARGQH